MKLTTKSQHKHIQGSGKCLLFGRCILFFLKAIFSCTIY